MPAVPTFSLYGESDRTFLGDWLHGESIAARSGRYDWEIRPHRHAHFFQILHLDGGSGEVWIEGWTAPLKAASVVTVPPGVPHGFRFSEDVQGSVLTILAEKAAEALRIEPGLESAFERPRLFHLADAESARPVAAALSIIAAELAERRPGRDVLILAQLASALLLLGRRLDAEPAAPGARPALERKAAEFRSLVNHHFRSERAVGFYARRLHVSETHLNRVCRAVLDRSALAVIHDRLLAEASRDLAFTTMSVQEIAHSLGFEDAAYFSRFFAKGTGLSPRAFRRASPA